MPDSYDVIVVGSGFAGAFFVQGVLQWLPADARVLLLERGPLLTPAEILDKRWTLRKNGDRLWVNKTKDKPWWHTPLVGGTSNAWYGNTPRMLPEDFALATRYGRGADWPITYDELEPHYLAAEQLMGIAGDSDCTLAPRSGPYPLAPHRMSTPGQMLKEAHPDEVFACPTARASGPGTGRPTCCQSFACNFCPISAKFTVPGGLAGVLADPRVTVQPDSAVQAVDIEAGRATGVLLKRDGKEERVTGSLVALAANALFNPHLLLRSGLEDDTVGRYLHEQYGRSAHVYLDGVDASDGSTSCTGHHWGMARGEHRRERGATLVELFTKPQLRLAPGRWRQLIRVTGVFEDLPDRESRVTLDPDDPERPRVHFAGVADYAERASDAFEADLEGLMKGLPVEKIVMRSPRKSEGHIMGSARMGHDPATSVVDAGLVHHKVRNLLVLGGSAFPTGAVANPSLTISALSLLAADRLRG